MMLVGPMKKKMVTTIILVVVIMTVIFGALGFLLLSAKQTQINQLEKQAEVVQKYVFTENFPAGHVIDEGDLVLVGVKAESNPDDSYGEYFGITPENREEIYRYTGTNYKAGESLKSLDILMGRRLKINASAKTILTAEMLMPINETPSDDLRLEEFSMIALPSDLLDGDYIDVRIMFPTGVDYSVLIGKKVESYTDNTIFLKLTEDEILTMGSAIVEAYMYEGTKLYATKYVDPTYQLYNYNNVDYVAKYKAAIPALIEAKEEKNLETIIAKLREENAEELDALIAQYPETYREEIGKQNEEKIKVSEKDITVEEIAKYIGLTEYGTQEIRTAIDKKDENVLKRYENKTVASKKSLNFTYPVNEKVAVAIKNNPNILIDVKNNFNIDELIAKEVEKYFEELYVTVDEEKARIEEQYERVVEQVKTDIQTQKDERVRFLNSLASEE